MQRILEQSTEMQVDTLEPARTTTNTVLVELTFAHFSQVTSPKPNSMARNVQNRTGLPGEEGEG